MSVPTYPGVRFQLGPREYVVPSLSLDDADRLWPKLGQLATLSDGDARAAMREAILTAIRRNYPELEEPDIRPHLDLGNYGPLFRAVMHASGLEQEKPTSCPHCHARLDAAPAPGNGVGTSPLGETISP